MRALVRKLDAAERWKVTHDEWVAYERTTEKLVGRQGRLEFCPGVEEYDWCMKQFTAIIHRGEPGEGGFWATCLEVPGANGQGETKEDCLSNLSEAIRLMLETEREEVLRHDPKAETAALLIT